MAEKSEAREVDWEAMYEAERFRIPSRELCPDVTRHFAWEGWSPEHKIPMNWLTHYARAFHFTDAELLEGKTTRGFPAAAGGVYFLFDDDECIYVGQTKRFGERALQHFDSGKRWTAHTYFEVPMFHVKTVEAYYIRRMKPRLNNCFPPNRTYEEIVEKLGLDKLAG